MQTSSAKCGQCGGGLPPGAPEGLCPRCLMASNLPGETTLESGAVGPEGVLPAQGPTVPPLPTSEVAKLFPALEILEFLGHGGMGAVYKARQPRLDRLVALKILLPEKARDPLFGERFGREARALARLNHSKIVAVYDFGEVQGLFYLLMEFVDGLTLRELLQTRKMAPEEALAIVPHICEALQYAHDLGIVHRDVKPENILIDKQGRVKIADFGIAKLVGGKDDQPALTGGGQVVGTPHYMAPEQIEKPRTVDHRADIYSLGVVFYEMLTGELPLGRFPAPSSRLHGTNMDARLDEVVLRALEKEPERRYQQAGRVKTDVETIAAQRASAASGSRQNGARGWRLPAAVAAVLLLLASGWFLFRDQDERRLRATVNYVAEQASVQDVVQELARQAGLGYDRQASYAQTDPLCRRWVNHVVIAGKSCREALDQILRPVGLRYQVKHGVICLSRLPGAAPPLSGGPAAQKLEAARKALTGAQKEPAAAKKLLLELLEKDKTVLDPDSLCHAYVYLGYIADRAANHSQAVRWYKQALEITQANSSIRELAGSGLEGPLVWIRHLDDGARSPGAPPLSYGVIGSNAQAVISLGSSSAGETLLFLTPDLNAADWQNHRVSHEVKALVTVAGSAPAGLGELKLSPIPAIPRLLLTAGTNHPTAVRTNCPAERGFHIYSNRNQQYVKGLGKKAFEGAHFAFYEDVKNPENFTLPEYRKMDSVLEEGLPKLTRLIASPTDVDGNSKILVFIGQTLTEVRDGGEAYTDGGNLSGPGNGSGDYGEIVYFTSPNNLSRLFASDAAERARLAEVYYPRNILHETVHLAQQAWAVENLGHSRYTDVPVFYTEGQAELLRYLCDFGVRETLSNAAANLLGENPAQATAFNYPYSLGALFCWFLHERFGEGVSRALLEKTFFAERRGTDPVSLAIPGYTEPMLTGLMYAAVYFDGSAFGKEQGLSFSSHPVGQVLKRALPVTECSVGSTQTLTMTYTGCSLLKVKHSEPACLRLKGTGGGVFVVVVAPN